MPPPPLQDGRPTLTVSQRRQFFEECRFIEVRNLAYIQYKKPDGEPLLRYEDTLDNREQTKQMVLAYEVAQGWLIPDGTEGQIQVPAQPTPQPEVQTQQPQGAQQMTQPFVPNGAPPAPQQPMGAPIPQPQYAPPPMQQMAPPPQMQQPQMQAPVPQPQYQPPPQPQMQAAPPPVANPAQAAAAGVPPQQEAPAQQPTGRRRKGAGTAVAPPPAAPPPPPAGAVPQPQFAPPPAPQQMAMQLPPPGPQMAPPPQAAPAPFGAPLAPAPQQFQPQAQQAAPQSQAAAPAADLTPVLARVDALAKIVEAQTAQLKTQGNSLQVALGMLHHLYLVNAQLQPQQGQPPLPQTLPEFVKYFQKFVGTPQ